MKPEIYSSKEEMGKAGAKYAANILKSAIAEKGFANFILATGASQFEFLDALIQEPDIDWDKTVMFHLDEYIGMSISHPASFRKYLTERFINHVNPGEVHLIKGDHPDPQAECDQLGALISKTQIDLAAVGIGENGHLAFNDPPADMDTEAPFIVVTLDEPCRKQQMGEGWFPSIDDVPAKAISMSIRQIMKSRNILCTVPDARKAQAVKDCLEGEVSALHPASILQDHPSCLMLLDEASASLLDGRN